MLLLYQALHCTVYTAFLHLHSTMLLLYPSESNFNVTMLFWFTFHYASTLSCPTVPSTNCRNSIYIPLCFYFIHDLRHVIVQAISEFTFHYASTLSGHPRKITRAPTNLHSTMLLLYPLLAWRGIRRSEKFTFHYASTLSSIFGQKRCFRILIYIPLCFYFIFL